MTDAKEMPEHAAPRHENRLAVLRSFARRGRARWGHLRRAAYRVWRHRWFRRCAVGLVGTFGVVSALVLGLWWRLSTGPIEIDLVTPWLASAIQDNFGGAHSVTVGGTQLERVENGRTALRLLDVVVKDPDGVVVASAPKAEVGISGSGLLSGRLRAESLNLVGAEMAVRIETDGNVTVFAGANSRPIATAPARPLPAPVESAAPTDTLRSGLEGIAGLLARIDALGETGLDGHDLRQLGLKNGNLTVDDQRNGKRWSFGNINVTLSRPVSGGVIFRLASETLERPWEVSAALRPVAGGLRAIGIEARKVSAGDILLALRMGEGAVETNLPLSATLRGEFTSDGVLRAARGQIIAESGYIRDPQDIKSGVTLDHADVRFTWDGQRRSLIVPFQIQGGGAQLTMVAHAEPSENDTWAIDIARGDPVIDPVIFSPSGEPGEEGFALNHINVRARFDPVHQRAVLDQAEIGRNDTRPNYNVGVGLNGSFDYSTPDPRLAFGVAGTRMPASVMKRLWPSFISTPVRTWVEEHIISGTVERVLIAGNLPISVINDPHLPLPDEGLSVDVETTATTFRPIDNLPPIRDADLIIHVTGRTANVALGRGTIEVASGRRLNIAGGTFEVPDTHPDAAPATAKFRIDGSVPAAATLLATDPLREVAGIVLDPATSRGTLSAQAVLNVILSKDHAPPPDYSLTIDLANFAADHILAGQKLEAQNLRVIANTGGYQVKGDAKINGVAGMIEFGKAAKQSDADLTMLASLDEPARKKLGVDFGPAVNGPVVVKVTGKVGQDDKMGKTNVEADFTQAKIDNLIPGWSKLPGKPTRATFVLTKDAKSIRFDDLTIDGQGALAKGSVELDSNGDIVSANFPVFGLSDGDRATLKVERGADGVLRVTMRGDVYDGRALVRSSLGSTASPPRSKPPVDTDVDVKIGAVLGHNGEAVRGLDFKLSRRSGHIRNFALSAKIGRDASLTGDIRPRPNDRVPVIYVETEDAGSLFRFTDTYPRMFGGQAWIAMDPPTQDNNVALLGQISVRNFSVRGEPAMERVVSGANTVRGSVEFTEARADFTRQPGRMTVRDGVLRGPQIGATIDGQIDYARDEIRMRGTFVPLYALNNMFGQIPIVGMFLGGKNEGLLGINYEAVGPLSAPRVNVNPISAVAPGLLRKLIPGPGMFDPNAVPPAPAISPSR